MVKVVSSILILAFLLTGVLWMRNPSGNYEPFGFFLSVVLNAVAYFSLKPTTSSLAIDGKPLTFDLSIGWNESPQGKEAVWLDWRCRLTPLIGREAEQKELRDWANSHHALSFKVIQADGGTGKTRLAAEFAQSLIDTKRWAGGFVNLTKLEQAQRLAWQGNTIVVVDYPEHSPERLAQLITAAKEGIQPGNKKNKLRILLLCRLSAGVNALLNQQGAQSYASTPMALGELAGKGNLNLLTQSLSRLAPTAPSVSQADFDAWLTESPLHSTALFVVALAIHLSKSPDPTRRFLNGKDLLIALVTREQARWTKAEEGHGLPKGVLTDVLAFATLLNGLPAAAVNTQLNDAYKWPANTLAKLHSALAEVWPLDELTQTYPTLAPDLLAAVLLWHWQSPLAKRGVPTDANLLASLAPVDWFGVTVSLQRWHMQAYDQTVRLQLGRPQDAAALAGLLQDAAAPGSDFANRLKRSFVIMANWTALADLAVAISKPATLIDGIVLDADQLAAQATQLNNHALYLASAGEHSGALKAAQEAVAICRSLAKTNPAAYESDLAISMNNLAGYLSATSDRRGALKAAQEAVEIRRRLVEINPAAYEPDLAMSINNLASSLSETGDRPGALKAAQEAVAIYRRLAKTNLAAYEPNLAMCINNLASCLSGAGDRRAAVKAAQEAVAIDRRLAETNPAAYAPLLAGGINNLAIRLGEIGDHTGALKAAREAADIYRRLAETNPVAYTPDLAMSIFNLAGCLSDTVNRPATLEAAKEAVALYEKVNLQTPGAFDVQLATARRALDGLS
jgi:hypothetical protein